MEISRNLYDVIIIGGGPAGGAGAGAGENGDAGHGQGFLSGEIKAQLAALFPKFQNPVIVEAELDESPLSGELAGFVGELDGLTDKLICRVRELDAKEREERAARGELSPSLRLYRSDGSGEMCIRDRNHSVFSAASSIASIMAWMTWSCCLSQRESSRLIFLASSDSV